MDMSISLKIKSDILWKLLFISENFGAMFKYALDSWKQIFVEQHFSWSWNFVVEEANFTLYL